MPNAKVLSEKQAIVAALAERIKSGTGTAGLTRDIVFEKALYQASCKAAMKGGRVDSESDVRFVVEKILSIPDITVCPHGRPVVINLTKSELDRQFGRE